LEVGGAMFDRLRDLWVLVKEGRVKDRLDEGKAMPKQKKRRDE